MICHGDALETQLKLLIENLDQLRSPGKYGQNARGLVFCSRVETVPGVVRGLQAKGVSCAEFTKNLSASERDETLDNFKRPHGRDGDSGIRILVCTYVLGRGFDFHNLLRHTEEYCGLTLVISLKMPRRAS